MSPLRTRLFAAGTCLCLCASACLPSIAKYEPGASEPAHELTSELLSIRDGKRAAWTVRRLAVCNDHVQVEYGRVHVRVLGVYDRSNGQLVYYQRRAGLDVPVPVVCITSLLLRKGYGSTNQRCEKPRYRPADDEAPALLSESWPE